MGETTKEGGQIDSAALNSFFVKRGILFFLAVALIVLARVWNWQQVFVEGKVYFIDADCYSRMTRVAAVMAQPGTVLRHHEFENWPAGTTPHTTVLLDYLIAGLAGVLGIVSDQNIDLAGAGISLILAVLAGFILWKWVSPFRMVTQIAVLVTFAISPILVHGTVLGRPDHQELLIFLLIAAFTTEWELQMKLGNIQRSTFKISLFNGLAWGFALWTSLFEPTILLVCYFAASAVVVGRKWFNRDRAFSALALGAVLLIALAIEHWRLENLPAGPLFRRWAKSIGELAPVGWWSPVYFGWVGWAVLIIPATLTWRLLKEKKRHIFPWLALLVVTFVLSVYAARSGYFFAIAFVFTLPIFLEPIRNRWFLTAFFLGLWPIAAEWDKRLWPDPSEIARRAEQREDYQQLRQICESVPMKGEGVMAPWWLSPPIAYWSGANCVAGSSHQSLSGIEDSARFYISRFPEKSRDILVRRNVAWVVAYEPDRVLATASSLMAMPAARDAFAVTLYQTPSRVPPFLQLVKETTFFKLYHVTNGL